MYNYPAADFSLYPRAAPSKLHLYKTLAPTTHMYIVWTLIFNSRLSVTIYLTILHLHKTYVFEAYMTVLKKGNAFLDFSLFFPNSNNHVLIVCNFFSWIQFGHPQFYGLKNYEIHGCWRNKILPHAFWGRVRYRPPH